MRALFRGCEVCYRGPGMGDGSALGYGLGAVLARRVEHELTDREVLADVRARFR